MNNRRRLTKPFNFTLSSTSWGPEDVSASKIITVTDGDGKTYSGSKTVTSNLTWCTVSNNSGNFTISVTENPNSSKRSATVSCTINGITKTVAVTLNYVMVIASLDDLPYDGIYNGHKYITNPKNGINYAVYNVGYSSSNPYGYTFWYGSSVPGETISMTTVGDVTYTYPKYNPVDKLTTLEASDDPATVYMGGNWKTPKSNQIANIINWLIAKVKIGDTYWRGIWLKTGVYNNYKYLFFPYEGGIYDGDPVSVLCSSRTATEKQYVKRWFVGPTFGSEAVNRVRELLCCRGIFTN